MAKVPALPLPPSSPVPPAACSCDSAVKLTTALEDLSAVRAEVTSLQGQVTRQDRQQSKQKAKESARQAHTARVEADLKLREAVIRRLRGVPGVPSATNGECARAPAPAATPVRPWARGAIVDWTPPFGASARAAGSGSPSPPPVRDVPLSVSTIHCLTVVRVFTLSSQRARRRRRQCASYVPGCTNARTPSS